MPKKKYNILYCGNFRPPHSTENHIASTLESMGHNVFRMQEDETSYDILLSQKSIDFMIYGRTWNNIMSKEVNNLQFLMKKTFPMISVHLDIWWGTGRVNEIKEHFMFRSDVMFTADGGHENEWKSVGIEHYYLPPGVLKKECYMAEPVDELKADIVFVGSWKWYHECHPFRKELIKWLQETYGDRFKLYPNDQYPCVRGHLLNQLYSSAKIVIGDSLDSPRYVSDRVPETLGRGGFLLHPENQALDEMGLKSGTHLITYKRWNWEDLKAKIDYWLEHDDDREKIREQGHRYVREKHTYTERLQEVIKELERRKMI